MGTLLNRFTMKRKANLSNEIQLRFLKRVHRLLTNGYPLLDALEMCMWDKQLKEAAEMITTKLKNGATFDQAFEAARFHSSITSYLFFASANGDLVAGIEKSIEMFEYRTNTIKKFQQVIRYPVILFITFSLLLYFINRQVLPSFQDLFHSNGEASRILNLSITGISWISSSLLIFIVVLVASLVIWRFTNHKLAIDKQIRLYEAIPLYRNIVKMTTSFFFATHFSTLLKAGLPYKDILTFLGNQSKLPIIAYYSNEMMNDLNEGIHFTHVIGNYTFLEPQLTAIFQRHENSDSLEKDLTVYAQMKLEDIENITVKTITYLQPAFFTLIACFVIFIYAVLMWPMFELIKTM